MDRRVRDAILRLEQFMVAVDDALAIPRQAGQFLHGLILARGATRGLEIGTSYGYSGLWIASALAANGGTLITIDRDGRKSDAARQAFASAGLAEHVAVRTEDAAGVIASLTGPFDFVLNDADKESCVRYVELLIDKLSDRAIVMTDNTIDLAEQLGEFIAWIRQRQDFYSTGLTIGNGMEMSVKRSVRSEL